MKSEKITIEGNEYEAVDTQIIQGMDVSCRDCDIFKARVPRSPAHLPLCCEKGNGRARESCRIMHNKGYKRIWRKV